MSATAINTITSTTTSITVPLALGCCRLHHGQRDPRVLLVLWKKTGRRIERNKDRNNEKNKQTNKQKKKKKKKKTPPTTTTPKQNWKWTNFCLVRSTLAKQFYVCLLVCFCITRPSPLPLPFSNTLFATSSFWVTQSTQGNMIKAQFHNATYIMLWTDPTGDWGDWFTDVRSWGGRRRGHSLWSWCMFSGRLAIELQTKLITKRCRSKRYTRPHCEAMLHSPNRRWKVWFALIVRTRNVHQSASLTPPLTLVPYNVSTLNLQHGDFAPRVTPKREKHFEFQLRLAAFAYIATITTRLRRQWLARVGRTSRLRHSTPSYSTASFTEPCEVCFPTRGRDRTLESFPTNVWTPNLAQTFTFLFFSAIKGRLALRVVFSFTHRVLITAFWLCLLLIEKTQRRRAHGRRPSLSEEAVPWKLLW